MTSSRGPLLLPITTLLLLLLFDCGTSYLPAVTRTARFNPYAHSTQLDCSTLTNDGYYCHQENGSTVLSFFGSRQSSTSDGRSASGAKRRRGAGTRTGTPVETSAAAKESRLMGSRTSDDENETDGATDGATTDAQTDRRQASDTGSELEKDLTEEDWAILSTIVQRSQRPTGSTADDPSSPDAMEQILIATLPEMPPRLTLKLRRAADGIFPPASTTTEERRDQLVTVGEVLVRVLDEELKSGKETLTTLLDAGEVRKLDGEIGRALREGRLDMAFFKVQ